MAISDWTNKTIMAKELIPIVLSIAVWGPYLKETSILLQSDNLSLVTANNKDSCRDAVVMYLLRCMWIFVAYFDIETVAKHYPGTDMFLSCTVLSYLPTPLPFSILHMISPKELDWLSLTSCLRRLCHWYPR